MLGSRRKFRSKIELKNITIHLVMWHSCSLYSCSVVKCSEFGHSSRVSKPRLPDVLRTESDQNVIGGPVLLPRDRAATVVVTNNLSLLAAWCRIDYWKSCFKHSSMTCLCRRNNLPLFCSRFWVFLDFLTWCEALFLLWKFTLSVPPVFSCTFLVWTTWLKLDAFFSADSLLFYYLLSNYCAFRCVFLLVRLWFGKWIFRNFCIRMAKNGFLLLPKQEWSVLRKDKHCLTRCEFSWATFEFPLLVLPVLPCIFDVQTVWLKLVLSTTSDNPLVAKYSL